MPLSGEQLLQQATAPGSGGDAPKTGVTAEQLLQMAGQGGAAAMPQGQAAPQAGGFATVRDAVMRAVKDRTVEPAMTMMNSNAGMMERGLAAVQLGATAAAATNPAGLAILGLGAATQAGTEIAGASPETARVAGGAMELGAGLLNMVRAGLSATVTSRRLAGELRRGAEPGMGVGEVVGRDLASAASTSLRRTAQRLGGEFDAIESRILQDAPELVPDSAAHGELQGLLAYVDDAAVATSKRVDAGLRGIAEKVGSGEAVPTKEVMKLRKAVGDELRYPPTTAEQRTAAKKLHEVHSYLTDALEKASPDASVGADYTNLRGRWVTEFVQPNIYLRKLTDRRTTPMQAFKLVFGSDDPNVMRTVTQVTQQAPEVMQKVRLGFGEALVRSASQDPMKAMGQLRSFRAPLTSLGAYTSRELDGLEFVVKTGSLPGVLKTLSTAAERQQTLLRTTIGASAAAHLASNPAALLAGAVAFGGLPKLRRLAMTPAGTGPAIQLSGAVVRATALGLRSLAAPRDRPAAQP